MDELQVIYFTLKNPKDKLQTLVEVLTGHFAQKQSIHVRAPDRAALNFISDLLWKEPKESFLPHSKEVLLPYQDIIYLSLEGAPLETFSFAFNLCKEPYPKAPGLKRIYELEDLSHPHKAAIFQEKFKTYQKAGYTLCSAH